MSETRQPSCPICGRPRLHAVRPFCSRRCADVDLARWLGGAYRISESDPEQGPVHEPTPAVED